MDSSPSLIRKSVTTSVRSPAKPRASLTPQDKGAVVLEIGHAYTKLEEESNARYVPC